MQIRVRKNDGEKKGKRNRARTTSQDEKLVMENRNETRSVKSPIASHTHTHTVPYRCDPMISNTKKKRRKEKV
jgi:hypothetical protein